MRPRTHANPICVAAVLSVLALIALPTGAQAPQPTHNATVLVITNDDLPTKLTGVTSPGPLLIDGKPFDWRDREQEQDTDVREDTWPATADEDYTWPNDSSTAVARRAFERPAVDDGYLPYGLQMLGNVIVPIGPDRFTCPFGRCADGGSALEIRRMEIDVACPLGRCPDGRDPLAVPGANRRAAPAQVHNIDSVPDIEFDGRTSRHLQLVPVNVFTADAVEDIEFDGRTSRHLELVPVDAFTMDAAGDADFDGRTSRHLELVPVDVFTMDAAGDADFDGRPTRHLSLVPANVHNVDGASGVSFVGRTSRHLGLAPVEVHNVGAGNTSGHLLTLTNVPRTIRGRAIKSHAPFNRRGGVGNATTTAIGQ